MICYLNKSDGKEEQGVFSVLVDKKFVKKLEPAIFKDEYFGINDRMFEGNDLLNEHVDRDYRRYLGR